MRRPSPDLLLEGHPESLDTVSLLITMASFLVYKNKKHRLGDGVCTLGRDKECCDIAFDDKELSRKHVLVIKEGPKYLLIDFRSTNGVMVNNKPVEQIHLKAGDWIKIGQQTIQFIEEGPAEGAPDISGVRSLSGIRSREKLVAGLGGPGNPLDSTLPAVAKGGPGSGQPGAGALTCILSLPGAQIQVQGKAPAPVPAPDATILAAKLANLIKVGRSLNSELNLTELMNKVIENALAVMRADRGLLMLVDEATGKLVPKAHKEMETVMQLRDGVYHISRSIVAHASTQREPVLVQDALADQRFMTSQSVQMYNIRSALCAPLINKDKFLGVLYVDNRIESSSFSEEDKEMLMAFADQAAIGIENAKLVDRIREETRKRAVLSRYFSPNIVEKIVQHRGGLTLGGEKVQATVLFADIRGFTSFSENRATEAVVEFLNDFLTTMTRVIFEKGGTLDKYLGDGLMAIFGAPFRLNDAPYWAVQAAVEMQQAMTGHLAEWENRYGFVGKLGIGINTGEVISGNIGSTDRLDYTVIGDPVNLAARLQAMAVKGDIVISEYTYSQVKERVRVELMGPVTVKGKSKEVEIFRLTGLMPTNGTV
ncbi:MAG: GAF domain-containing protein [Candidatus Riflebacteria bacterium]|nr:GAF domain-containing protein [Candidatus Riflebacteria bacterium]